MKYLTLLLSFLFTVTVCTDLYSQGEDELDREIFEDSSGTQPDTGKETEVSRWDIYGYLENNNHFVVDNNNPDGSRTAKLEGKGQLSARYGLDGLYARTVLNTFFYPETGNTENIHDDGKLEARELYLFARFPNMQLKVGKQLFQWGTGDVFQVTNYLDRFDMREFVATDKDDRYTGVFALSVKLFIDDFSLEGCVSPVHSPLLLPDGLWKLQPGERSTPAGPVNIEIDDPEGLDNSFNNVSYAIRGGGTIGILDFHIIYFNGINNNLVLNSVLTKNASQYTINLKPYFKRIHALGFDLAYAVDKLTIRVEGSYVPNMPVQPEAESNDIAAALTSAMAGSDGEYVITEMEETTALSYVLGADYLVWGNNGRLYIEWTQVYYPESDRYGVPLLSKQLHVRLEDKWYNEHITAKLGTNMRIDGDVGHVVNAELGWDFKTGMTLLAGCHIFTGNNDELYTMFSDKDMIYTRARMEF